MNFKNLKRFLPFVILFLIILTISLITFRAEKRLNLDQERISNNFDAKASKNYLQLPEFFIQNLDESEKEFSLQDLINKNNKYSVVNFFASWCSTCAAEHEILMKLKNDNSINIYGVAWHDFKDSAKKFIKKNGNPFVKIALDSQGLFTKIIGIHAVPETIIVNSKGFIIAHFQGGLTEKNIKEIQILTKSGNKN